MVLIIFFISVGIFILGANFAVAFMVARARQKEYEPVILFGKYLPVEVFTVGVTICGFGVMWLLMWIYFLVSRFDSFAFKMSYLIPHVVVQLITALALITGGLATLMKWKRWRGVYLTSIAVLVGSMALSIGVYGQTGHGIPFLMYVFSVWTFVIAGALTAELFVMDRMTKENFGQIPTGQIPNPT